MECVDFEAGVVGEDEEVGGVGGVVEGLGAGVAFEGGRVFGWGGDLGEVGEGFDLDVSSAEEIALGGVGEVSQLAGVGGGDVEVHGYRVSRGGFEVSRGKAVGFADAHPSR